MRTSRALAIALIAVFPAVPLPAQQPATPPPVDQAPPPLPTPVPKPFEDIIKLWKANLSEDFVRRQIETGSIVYDLSADDIIRCRNGGLPESLINAMLETTKRAPGAMPVVPAAASPLPGAPAAATPLATAAPTPSLAAQANQRWEGLARRNSGVVLFKSRWDIGTFEFKQETLRWLDAHDAGKNLFVPARQITEQFLTCLKKPGGNECFEWGFKTKDAEYHFRDVAWRQGENKKALEIFDFMKAIYPALISSERPVDQK